MRIGNHFMDVGYYDRRIVRVADFVSASYGHGGHFVGYRCAAVTRIELLRAATVLVYSRQQNHDGILVQLE
jgi:hypothetical protein